MKINSISPQDNEYLRCISHIAKSPQKLHFIGKLPEQRLTSVAIVGSRKPTAYGKEVTYRLSYDLAARGVVIISGLALGVDGIAHRAALDAGGRTLAILANGLDYIYPATHRELAKQILASGSAIISEYEPGVSARAFQFLARNRLVSGLADAVIVTEATARSGSFSTVNHALDQNKEVFAVPGNITSPLSAGCNALLKQGAHPVTSANDILEVIAPDLVPGQGSLPLGSNELEAKLIDLLARGVRSGEELQQASAADPADFAQALTSLELNGHIRPLGANRWTLT